MKKVMAAAVAAAVLIAGCGSSAPKQTAACNTAAGAASGDALVGQFSAAKFQVASILAKSYTSWVDGDSASDGGPHKALCPLEKQAAASIVLHYASTHQARFAASSSAAGGGKDAETYLKAQGVACGKECGLRPTAKDQQLQLADARSTGQQQTASTQSDSACTQADDAGIRLTSDVAKHSGSDGDVTQLSADLSAFAEAIQSLESQASPSQSAQLKNGAHALQSMEGEGATAIGLGLGTAQVKDLPSAIQDVCS